MIDTTTNVARSPDNNVKNAMFSVPVLSLSMFFFFFFFVHASIVYIYNAHALNRARAAQPVSVEHTQKLRVPVAQRVFNKPAN